MLPSQSKPNTEVYPPYTHGTGEVSSHPTFIDNKPMIQGSLRSVIKFNDKGEAHLINSGLTDKEGAKFIAKKIFTTYDKDNAGSIDVVKTAPILQNAYAIFDSVFKPEKNDVNHFFRTLDVNKDNRVTLQDMEALCIRYLTTVDSSQEK